MEYTIRSIFFFLVWEKMKKVFFRDLTFWYHFLSLFFSSFFPCVIFFITSPGRFFFLFAPPRQTFASRHTSALRGVSFYNFPFIESFFFLTWGFFWSYYFFSVFAGFICVAFPLSEDGFFFSLSEKSPSKLLKKTNLPAPMRGGRPPPPPPKKKT